MLNKNIICFDPGNHTGWCMHTAGGTLIGGTIMEENMYEGLTSLFCRNSIDLVIMESFNLYPAMAKRLAWNSFYPCEVIGVIKYLCYINSIPMIMQQPSVKKYAGTLNAEYVAQVKGNKDIAECMCPKGSTYMEHTKDSIQHLQYYLKNHI